MTAGTENSDIEKLLDASMFVIEVTIFSAAALELFTQAVEIGGSRPVMACVHVLGSAFSLVVLDFIVNHHDPGNGWQEISTP